LIRRHRTFGRLLEIVEHHVRQGASEALFQAAIQNEPALAAEPDRLAWEPFLLETFRSVAALERDDWNRIWCRIVRNHFASVAIGRCRFIAGNPPWVRWSELPAAYAERIKPTCD